MRTKFENFLGIQFLITSKGEKIVAIAPTITIEFLTRSEIEEMREILDNTIRYYDDEGLLTDKSIERENWLRVEEELHRPVKKEEKRKVCAKDHLYVIRDAQNKSIKVGRSKNPEGRIKTMSVASSHEFEKIAVFETYGFMEAAIHDELKRAGLHLRGEWFIDDRKTFDIITRTIKNEEFNLHNHARLDA